MHAGVDKINCVVSDDKEAFIRKFTTKNRGASAQVRQEFGPSNFTSNLSFLCELGPLCKDLSKCRHRIEFCAEGKAV